MAYHVQAEVHRGPTVYIGWYECGDLLAGKFEEGFSLANLWPSTILMDKKGVDGSDLRSITDDESSQSFRVKLLRLR